MDMISGLRYAAQKKLEEEAAAALEKAGDVTAAFSLEGRTVVVTGAARGIGRQAAITFAQAGANVVAADVLDVAGTVAAVEGTGRKACGHSVDVAQRESVDALAARALSEFGRIDVWANVAGVIRYMPIVDATEDDLSFIVGVNQLGVYRGIAAAARAMIPNRSGSIINIASAGGDVPAPTLSIYGMTKAAVMHLTKTAAAELGPSGIRVNAIAPGFIETPMVSPYWTNDKGEVDVAAREQTLSARAGQSPLRMTGDTTDITYAMLYLAADASRFMTGQTLRPNGGVYMA